MADAVAYELQRDVVRIAGPDAISFLQGQLSQDVVRLGSNMDSEFTFLLEPQGKVCGWGRLTRMADEVFFDVDRGYGDAVIARLNRFKLRTKADIELVEFDAVAIRGNRVNISFCASIVASFDWPGFDGIDLLGTDLDRVVAETPGVVRGTAADYERQRIQAGVPAMGRELDANTIPNETGDVVIEKSVSFTKGCYTGQELVARVDSRGNNTPRRLRLVRIDGGVPAAGSDLLVDDKVVGKLTSVAPADGGAVALAFVQRAVTPPIAAVVVDQAGRRYTSICVPLAGPPSAMGTGDRAAT